MTDGVSRSLSLTRPGSSTNAAFGAELGMTVDVVHSGAGPAAFVATHPAGNAGAVTPSKFSTSDAMRVPLMKVKAKVPRFVEPSVKVNVVTTFAPHIRLGSTRKVNFRQTDGPPAVTTP